MPLHRLTSITHRRPDADAARVFYRDFGSPSASPGASPPPRARATPPDDRAAAEPARAGHGVDDPEDLGRIAARLERLAWRGARGASAPRDRAVTGIKIVVEMAERIVQPAEPARP